MTIQRTFSHLDPIDNEDSTTESGLQPTNVQRTEQFDYQEAVDAIQIELTAAENSTLTALEHYRNVGERLETFEANCRHGQYGKMLKELGIGRTSAHNYRQLYCNWDLIKDQKGISQSKALAIIAASDTSQLEEQTIDTTAERVTEESPGNNPTRQLRQSPRTTAPRRRALDVALHTFNSLHHTTLTPDQLDNRETILSLPPQTAAELYRYLVYTCNQHPNKLPQPVQDAFLASGASLKPVTQQVRTTEASGQEVRRIERFVEIEVPTGPIAETCIPPSDTTEESAFQPAPTNALRDRMPNDEGARLEDQQEPLTQPQQAPEGARDESLTDENEALHHLIEQLQAQITQLNERNEQLEIELAKQATTPQATLSSFNALEEAQELEQDNQTLALEIQKMAASNQQLRQELKQLKDQQPIARGFKSAEHLKDLDYIQKLEQTIESRDTRVRHLEDLLSGGIQKHKENALQLQPRQWAQMQAFPPVLPSQMYTTNLPPVPQEIEEMGLVRYYHHTTQMMGSLLSDAVAMSALLAEHNLTVPDQLTAAVSAELKKTLLPTIA